MQKAIVPASLLTIAFQNERSSVKKHFELNAVKEKAQATASHMHDMFFGARQLATDVKILPDNKAGEPDYYSSYE
jgi:hypothetical protein